MGDKLIYAFILEIIFFLISIVASRIMKSSLKKYGFRITKKLLVRGLTLSVVIGIFLGLISSPVSLSVEWVFLSIVLAPVCEEFFFRGFLQTNLMEWLTNKIKLLKIYLTHGLIVTAFIFGLFHLFDTFLLDMTLSSAFFNSLFAILLGILLGYVYQETRSVFTPILMHSCLNGIPIFVSVIIS